VFDNGTLIRAQRFDMPLVQWSVDSEDWSRPGTGRIVRNVLDEVRDRSIVLMHDGGGPRLQTVQALERILPVLKKRGFVMQPLPMCR
jgi:peptidoglycan/xylan/chitin deacetylase (PgdA/CDA1 family)